MRIAEIFKEWEIDSKIDITNLHFESLKIPSLHYKYYKIYITEKSILNKMKSDYFILKNDKTEFLTLGPNEETDKKGWKLPPRGKILKSEIETYLQSDNDIIEINLKISTQQEKIELLKSIIETLKQRSFHIREALEFLKFQNGT